METETARSRPPVVTFGEIMLRLATPLGKRLGHTDTLLATYGGGEANVAVSLALFGHRARFVTRMPEDPWARGALSALREHGVEVDHVVMGGDRFGVYYLETGAAQRPSRVVYDRAGSAFATLEPGMVDWARAFDGAAWFHVTGISPAVSRSAWEATVEAVEAARAAGLTVSVDLNYRAKLWQWGMSPGEAMEPVVAGADIVIGNEEDAQKVFGIEVPGASAHDPDASAYREVALRLQQRFPRVTSVAFTVRGSHSASDNSWSGVLWHDDRMHKARDYRITPIVDRVGSGDAFAAGIIHGLASRMAAGDALEFAVASACLKHSLNGDFNLTSREEVLALAGGDGSGRVVR